LVNELSNYTNAVFIGEPTAENINFYGDNRKVQLPNTKLNTYLSFAWWQDKPQWENGPWLAPHIAVDTSFEQYRTNQDPVMEAALNFSDNNFVLNPMAHLTALFEAGKLEEVESEAMRMVQNPQYQFFDFEGEFNRVGYRLIDADRLQEATYVLGMNAKLFPDSANVWDSLAEAHWKSGDLQKAKELYGKAIEMDPKGSVGDNARRMLEELNKE
jgi:tetratricopeptide (TPR) repeat protein